MTDTITAIVAELSKLPVRRDVIRLLSNDLRLLLQQVADETVSQRRLQGKQQDREVATARKLYALLAKNVLGEAPEAIARALHKERTTICTAVAAGKVLHGSNRRFRIKYDRIAALWS
jgi:chromosomal replication initiation ATPase DnaA